MLKSIEDVYNKVKDLSQINDERKLIEILLDCLLKLTTLLENFKYASNEIVTSKHPTLFW